MTTVPSAVPALDRTPDPVMGPGKLRGWPSSIILGIVIALAYLANGREIGAFDTIPTTLLPLAIIRGDGLRLDRFRPLLREWGTPLPVFVTESFGHIISRYPVGPALAALPLIAPQVMVLDRIVPGWDRDLNRVRDESRRMGKRAAAVLAALVAIALHRLLVGLGLCRVAIPAVIATALGSSLWSVASQALWQHGPAALALTLTMLLLHPQSVSRGRMLLAGLATAMLVVTRPLDLIFALFVFAWVAWTHPRRLAWFLPAPVVLGFALVGYNEYYFARITGGQDQLEQQHRELHGVGGPWSGDLRTGMAGTLLSPNRGLFIFSPWVAVAIAVSPVTVRKLATGSLVRWLLLALVPYLFVLSKYAVWWAGGSFGPRYWTEAFPLFGVLLACGLDWARDRSRGLMALFALTILLSVMVHAIGAFCFPSTWNFFPVDIDVHHERLWDWRDTELSRCIKESLLGNPVPIRLPGR
jgi:hypothetical protein